MSVIGLQIGPYELVAPAAAPGPGLWFLGRRTDPVLNAPKSVLVRLRGRRLDLGWPGPLHEQFTLLRSLQDERVPRAVGLYEDEGAIALSHVTGMPLTGAIIGRRANALQMTPATLLDLLADLMDMLAIAHDRRIHHGHLDPDHIWLTDDAAVRVLGFGDGWGVMPPLRWMAPERARGWPQGPWTDQWAVGALGAALVSGDPPWNGPDPGHEARAGDPAWAVAAVSHQWPALGAVFERMMSSDPRARFTSMHQALEKVRSLAAAAQGASDRQSVAAWLARNGPFDSILVDDGRGGQLEEYDEAETQRVGLSEDAPTDVVSLSGLSEETATRAGPPPRAEWGAVPPMPVPTHPGGEETARQVARPSPPAPRPAKAGPNTGPAVSSPAQPPRSTPQPPGPVLSPSGPIRGAVPRRPPPPPRPRNPRPQPPNTNSPPITPIKPLSTTLDTGPGMVVASLRPDTIWTESEPPPIPPKLALASVTIPEVTVRDIATETGLLNHYYAEPTAELPKESPLRPVLIGLTAFFVLCGALVVWFGLMVVVQA